jgi:hypothetical protein
MYPPEMKVLGNKIASIESLEVKIAMRKSFLM